MHAQNVLTFIGPQIFANLLLRFLPILETKRRSDSSAVKALRFHFICNSFRLDKD